MSTSAPTTVVGWLRANGYTGVVEMIEAVLKQKTATGLKTRRNWWDVLAGTQKGDRRSDSGFEFPILAAARRRKGWPVVPGELKNADESPPPAVVESARWPAPKAPARTERKMRKASVPAPPPASPTSASRGAARRTGGR